MGHACCCDEAARAGDHIDTSAAAEVRVLTAVTGCGDSVPLGESSDADWWPGVYSTPLYTTVLYTVHGHLSRLTWCRQVAASGVAPASARGPASAALAAHTPGTLTTAQI